MTNNSPKSRLVSIEAERATIGAIVCNASILGWLELTEGHFTDGLNKQVFAAMMTLYDSDRPIDGITVLDACLARNSRIDCSAVSKLVVEAFTSENAEYWAKILEEARRMRVLSASLAAATKIISGMVVGDSGAVQDSLLDDMEQLKLVKSERASDLEAATRAELARMEAQWDGGDGPRYETGIRDLDFACGGVPIGVVSVLGARTGTGKSTVLWNMMFNAAQRGDHCLIMSNEDRPDVMARLGIAHAVGVERRDLLAGRLNPEEKDAVRAEVERLAEVNSRVHTLRIHGRTMKEICREATGLIRRYGIKIIALDYIQNVASPPGVMNRTYGIEENLTTLEAMIAAEDLPCIVVGQLKRMEDGRIPTKEDLKDSGALEQKAKLIMLMSEGDAGTVDVDIAKNSEGRENVIARLHIDLGLGRIA